MSCYSFLIHQLISISPKISLRFLACYSSLSLDMFLGVIVRRITGSRLRCGTIPTKRQFRDFIIAVWLFQVRNRV